MTCWFGHLGQHCPITIIFLHSQVRNLELTSGSFWYLFHANCGWMYITLSYRNPCMKNRAFLRFSIKNSSFFIKNLLHQNRDKIWSSLYDSCFTCRIVVPGAGSLGPCGVMLESEYLLSTFSIFILLSSLPTWEKNTEISFELLQ